MQADKNTSIFLKSYDRSKWETVKLGDIVEIISGGTPKTDTVAYWDGDIPWCTPTDITSNSNKYIHRTERNITEKGLANSAARLLPKNTLLLCSRATIGAVKIAGQSMCTNQGFKNLVCKEKISHEFLFYYIPKLKAQMLSQASGSTFLEISKAKLANIELEIPCDIEEQNFIANTLAAIDNHINNLESKISKYENIKKSTINLLLKPKADWIKKTIGDVCSFFTSSSKSAYIDPDGQYFIVDMGAVSDDGTLIAQKRTNYAHDFLHKNDLIMPKDDIGGGNIIGKAVAIQENDKYILSDHVYKLQTELDATFLSYLINSPKINKYMRAMATGSAQLGISKRTVSKCELCFPADLGQQKAIAQKLGAIDEHINNLKQQLKKQRNLKQGLMQYFFGD